MVMMVLTLAVLCFSGSHFCHIKNKGGHSLVVDPVKWDFLASESKSFRCEQMQLQFQPLKMLLGIRNVVRRFKLPSFGFLVK